MRSRQHWEAQRLLRNASVELRVLILKLLPSLAARDRLNKAIKRAAPKRYLKKAAGLSNNDTGPARSVFLREFEVWETGVRARLLKYYEATKASCPIENPVPVGGAGEAVLIDPHFNPFSRPSGHHGTLNHFYLDLLRELGLDVCIHGKFALPMPNEEIPFSFVPTFTFDLYKPIPRSFSLAEPLQDNVYFGRELENIPTSAKVYVVHSVRHNLVVGLSAWIKQKLDREECCIILGIIDNQLGVDPNRDQVVLELYRQAFALLGQLRKAHLLIYCETQTQIDLLRQAGANDLDLRLFRYVGAELAGRSSDALPRKEDGKVCIGFLGGTRAERGVDLLPSVVAQVDKVLPVRTHWVLQLNLQQLRKIGVSDQDIASLANHENCELVEAGLSVEDYYALMGRIDVLILPYRERYETTGSGVFIEALSLGKVLVIPQRGWMAECALMCGSQPITFDTADTMSVSKAIERSVENFNSLRIKAIKAAQVWNTHQAAGSQIQSWLGERLADPLNQAVQSNMVGKIDAFDKVHSTTGAVTPD